jgi:hypothetical protein
MNFMPNDIGDTWTWRDSIDRINKLDLVINQIVHDTVIILSLIFAIIGSFFLFFSNNKLNEGQFSMLLWIIRVLAFGGFLICIITILNLSRQERIRQWYFSIIPKDIPMLPDNQWCPSKRVIICKIGKIGGYCILWIGLFSIIAVLFLMLTGMVGFLLTL